ncbi:MAG TPA: hypothetical protein VNZ86_03570, partial [Bacteroidia bacterium]|nr:hypothetical protein [Bacteroidia bacterium]
MLRYYVISGNPFLFMEGTFPGKPDRSGLLTSLSPKLEYIELLLQNGSPICLLAVAGLLLMRRELTQKLWIFLIFSFVPLILLTLFMKPPELWAAYKARYVGLFVILLTPFCAYALAWMMTVHTQFGKYGWHTGRMALPAVLALYNLWLIYLVLEARSATLIFCLAFGSVLLASYLLERSDGIFFSLSLSPLFAIIFASNQLVAIDIPRSYVLWYFILLLLFYTSFTKYRRMVDYASYRHWEILGLVILLTLGAFNLFADIKDIPEGDTSSINVGWRIRQLFTNGTLTADSKIFAEVSKYNYLCMQVLSNHPANFILDRRPELGYGYDT